MKITIGFCINGYPCDVLLGFCFKVYGTENSTEYPEISFPLRLIDRQVTRMFFDNNFQLVFFSRLQQFADVVFKLIKGPLVYRTGQFTIYFHFSIGHHSIKNNHYLLVLPIGRDGKPVAIRPRFFYLVFNFIMSIIVSAKPLLFPAGRYGYRCPFPAVHSRRTEKLPVDRFFGTGSRQGLNLTVLCQQTIG